MDADFQTQALHKKNETFPHNFFHQIFFSFQPISCVSSVSKVPGNLNPLNPRKEM